MAATTSGPEEPYLTNEIRAVRPGPISWLAARIEQHKCAI